MTSQAAGTADPKAEEQAWLLGLNAGREEDLERIFLRYHRYIVVTAYQLLHEDGRAQDLVQDLFFSLWTKRKDLRVDGSLKAYLRKAIVNRCIDEIRREKRFKTDDDSKLATYSATTSSAADAKLHATELQQLINRAIDRLPDRCRTVFALSRFQQLSNKEIAQKLDISIKTVENQMTKALRQLRLAVAGHLPEWMILLLLFNH